MKNRIRRILAAVAAMVMAVMVMAVPVAAAPEYTPLKLTTSTKIPLVLQWIWPELDNIPKITFYFYLSPDNSATGDEKPGQVSGGLKSYLFNMGSSGHVVDNSYVEGKFDFTLNGLTFNEPGVYSFIVYESEMYQPATGEDRTLFNKYKTNFDKTQYELKVEIGTQGDGTELALKGVWVEKQDAPGEKMDTLLFHNVSQPHLADLTVTNTVAGEDTSGDFTFTIDKLEGAQGEYTVTTPAGDKTITVAEDGTVTGDAIVLKNGESFVIKELPARTTYTITETDPGENYTVTIGGTETLVATGELQKEGTTVEFLNTLQETVPTGIVLDIAPFALMALMLGGSMVLLGKKRRSNQ